MELIVAIVVVVVVVEVAVAVVVVSVLAAVVVMDLVENNCLNQKLVVYDIINSCSTIVVKGV